MKIIERFTLWIILGSVAPITGLLAGWWLFMGIFADVKILIPALTGLLCGVLLDVFLLKQAVQAAYQVSWLPWAVVYLFYAICIFGFFMGVPLINVALGVPFGILVAGKLFNRHAESTEVNRTTLAATRFSTMMMLFICLASATIALLDPYTAANLEGMLMLPFTVTPAMIWGLIIIGGSMLLITQWWVTKLTILFSWHLLAKDNAA